MNNHIIVYKKHLFRCGNVQGGGVRGTSLFRRQGLATAIGTGVDHRELTKHAWSHHPHRTVETLLQERLGSGPALIDKPIKDGARETGPDVLSTLPTVFLKKGAKVRLPEPQDTEVGLVCLGVLGQPDPIQILRIQPIHICVGIPWVTRPPICLSPINCPEIRHNVQIVLGNITSSIRIEEPRDKL